MLDEYFMMNLSRENGGGGDSNQPDAEGDGGHSGDAKKENRKPKEGGELCLSSLPLLLEGHSPVPEGLPMFLLRLAAEVCLPQNICHKTVYRGVFGAT